MAVTFIPVDMSKVLGNELLSVASQARDFGERLTALKRVIDSMKDGTDCSVAEAQIGLPSGKGADVSYLIDMLVSSLAAVPQFALLPDWFGQV